jgi:hypothetical protein
MWMMKIIESVGAFVSSLEMLAAMVVRLQAVLPTFVRLVPFASFSYRNRLLEFAVDINDPTGKKAVVRRRQTIEFRGGDTPVIREPVWGDGNQLARYKVQGATQLGVRREGSREVVLLGLKHRPVRGQVATLTTASIVRGGFLEPDEYFETFVERPTDELALQVLFPRRRAPRDAKLVIGSEERLVKSVPLQRTPDGRPLLSWREREPKLHRVYSLRWSW